jgi:hypothetical protein
MLVSSGKRLGWLLERVLWGSRRVFTGLLYHCQFSEAH